MRVTAQLAEALVNLRGNRDFETVMKSMQEHIAEATRQAIDADGVVQSRAAGAVKALEQWPVAFANAPALLDKFRNSNQAVR